MSRTTCKNGHLLDEANSCIRKGGWLECRVCRREYQRVKRAGQVRWQEGTGPCKIKGCPKPRASRQAYCYGHRTTINRYVWRLRHQPELVQVMALAVSKWQNGAKGHPHEGRRTG